MNNYIPMDFGDSPIDALLSSLQAGQSVQASAVLTALDEESEEAVLELLEQLDARQVTVVLDEIPMISADSPTALRLRREAKLVQAGTLLASLEETDPLKLYLQELAAVPVCGDLPQLEQALLEANEAGDMEAPVYHRVFDLCMSRVVELAMGYAGKGVLLADLIQEASLGLWDGLFAYRGGDLEQFRDARIHRSMVKAVICQAHAAGVGQKLRQALEDYRSVDERLLTELGRNPTREELAQAMHMSTEQVALVADMVENARMLSRAKNPENAQKLSEEEDQAVEDTAYFQMRQRIAELLSVLPPEAARLLSLRYGLEGGAPLTPEQTGEKLGMTPEEVNAAEAAALSQLRKQ